MSRMKEGEEEKTKSYTALVWTQKSIENEDISFINDIKVLSFCRFWWIHRGNVKLIPSWYEMYASQNKVKEPDSKKDNCSQTNMALVEVTY